VYQGVATRNAPTTREILAHRTGAEPNFLVTLIVLAVNACGGGDKGEQFNKFVIEAHKVLDTVEWEGA
jgi:hypothetical protein